jgi:signal transduction histidine kinase
VGLLAAVATASGPIRVRDLGAHPGLTGFPARSPSATSFLGVAIRQAGENRGNLYLLNKQGGQEFTEEDQLALETLSHRVGVILELSRRRCLQDRDRARLLVLARAGRQLAEPMELESTLLAISRLMVPDLADLCRVSVLREGGAYRTVLATHRDPVKQKLLDRLVNRSTGDAAPEIVRTALETGRPQIRRVSAQYPVERLAWDQTEREILEQVGARLAIAAPLIRGERPIGLLTLVMAESGRTFGEEDICLVEQLAAEAVLALERSRLYRSALEAIQARDGILALVSHDLMNPLAAIKLSAHSLLEHGLSGRDSVGQRQIAVIQGAARRMDRLIGELRDAASIDGGQLRVELNPEHGRALLEEAALMVAPQVEAAAHRLEVALRADSTEILCDRQRVFQVVANLVDNAVKFTPPGGRIRIATETLSDTFQVSVSDTGPGLRESEMERVFERYWRGRSGGTQSGSGLGLYIARGIVQAHGGRIWAQNEAGGGTRFTFALPLCPSADLVAAPVPGA